MKKRFLNLLAPFLPLLLPAAEPVFYFPLDGSGDVIGADGKKMEPQSWKAAPDISPE